MVMSGRSVHLATLFILSNLAYAVNQYFAWLLMKLSNLDLHVFLCSLRIQCINVIARLNWLVLLCSICVRSCFTFTVNPVLNGKSKRRPKIGFQDRLSLTVGLKYCRILQYFRPVLSYFKAFVLSIFEWLLKTCFTEHVPR